MDRDLTEGELKVMAVIREMYGEQNLDSMVFFSDNEACLSIVNSQGESEMFASVTNLANWLASGDIKSEQELREKWLSK